MLYTHELATCHAKVLGHSVGMDIAGLDRKAGKGISFDPVCSLLIGAWGALVGVVIDRDL